MNKTVTASGMVVKAQAEGSIVITSAAALPVAGTKSTDHAFNDASATVLYASTHAGVDSTYTTGLKRVSNADFISPETGSALNSTAVLTYVDAVNAGATLYYKDYAVFIAGDGQSFSNQDLTISVSGVIAGNGNINKAISVDFYGESVTTVKTATVNAANYLGTLNVAGVVNNGTDNGTTTKTSFVISNVNIPQTGTSAAYAVTMRVFYDGNLIETGGTYAYTAYEAATGVCPDTDAPYYYKTASGTGVTQVSAGSSVASYYVVKSSDSTYRFARTTEVANLNNVTLTATFTASSPTT